MSRKRIFIISLIVLLSPILYRRLDQLELKTSNDYPVHNLNSGYNYTTIQEAIDANETLNGHTIKVDTGIYYEHVTIAKSVFLFGESSNVTIIDGNGTGTVVQISANNVTIANFTIRNGGHGLSWLDSCIYGNYHSNILIRIIQSLMRLMASYSTVFPTVRCVTILRRDWG